LQESELVVVTGAFSYTGKYITRRLLNLGKRVRTLTGHPNRPNPFGDRVSVAAYDFDNPSRLEDSLRGATTLINTYWVRFSHGAITFDRAVENTTILLGAAKRAGVRRIVQVSITNPSESSSLPYFRGKAQVEKAVRESGLSHAILRPAVIFGPEDILINNIAWFVRNFPVFGVPGRGDYGLQPIFVEDMADLVVAAGARRDNFIADAVGPEIFGFEELVRLIGETIGRPVRIVHVSPAVAWAACRLAGLMVRDVVLTREEIDGLMANLLVSSGSPTGTTRLSDWLKNNAASAGAQYASELARHYR
jgi:NADH dehydrogenase